MYEVEKKIDILGREYKSKNILKTLFPTHLINISDGRMAKKGAGRSFTQIFNWLCSRRLDNPTDTCHRLNWFVGSKVSPTYSIFLHCHTISIKLPAIVLFLPFHGWGDWNRQLIQDHRILSVSWTVTKLRSFLPKRELY